MAQKVEISSLLDFGWFYLVLKVILKAMACKLKEIHFEMACELF